MRTYWYCTIICGVAITLWLSTFQGCSSIRPTTSSRDAETDNSTLMAQVKSDGLVEAEEVEAVSHVSQLIQENKTAPPPTSPASGQKAKRSNSAPTPVTSTRKPSSSGSMRYEVKRGDTLMKVAFKALADPLRWKEVYELNRSVIQGAHGLSVGVSLQLPVSAFAEVSQNGLPYLIHLRDTLSKISRRVYGTPARWSGIWHNNPELIRDPNRIYAGFTLYYVPNQDPQKSH